MNDMPKNEAKQTFRAKKEITKTRSSKYSKHKNNSTAILITSKNRQQQERLTFQLNRHIISKHKADKFFETGYFQFK